MSKPDLAKSIVFDNIEACELERVKVELSDKQLKFFERAKWDVIGTLTHGTFETKCAVEQAFLYGYLVSFMEYAKEEE